GERPPLHPVPNPGLTRAGKFSPFPARPTHPRIQSSAVKLGIAITYRHTPERHARCLPTAATVESIRALNTGGKHAPGNEPTVRAVRCADRGAARDRLDRAGAGGDRCGHRRARYLSADPRLRDRAAEPGSRG